MYYSELAEINSMTGEELKARLEKLENIPDPNEQNQEEMDAILLEMETRGLTRP